MRPQARLRLQQRRIKGIFFHGTEKVVWTRRWGSYRRESLSSKVCRSSRSGSNSILLLGRRMDCSFHVGGRVNRNGAGDVLDPAGTAGCPDRKGGPKAVRNLVTRRRARLRSGDFMAGVARVRRSTGRQFDWATDSIGVVRGPVKVLTGPAKFAKLQPGDVLVCS